MVPNRVHGLPTHVLLLHLVVVLVPLAAVLVVLAALWPLARARLGPLPVLASVASLVVVPLTANAGKWLEERLGSTPLIERHAELGEQLWIWVLGLTVAAVVVWRFPVGSARGRSKALRLTAAVAAVAMAVGTTVAVYRVGDSGAQAVWQGSVSDKPR